MEEILKINNLCKHYPSFSLKNVSFSINKGEIMGFIGRNGAGKTTTLKSIMNLVHYEQGEIIIFGKDNKIYELENKQRIGFALSELNYYPQKKLKTLSDVTAKFFDNFDKNKFAELCRVFKLDINKRVEQLSSGMKVKYSLAIALSHKAELLILDEPTSGLDPVSRDEVLDMFREIVKNNDRAILFSTHITSDLDKCATNITYIHDGSILYTGTKKGLLDTYLFVSDSSKDKSLFDKYISYKELSDRVEGLIKVEDKKYFDKKDIKLETPDLEQIMVYLERGKNNESITF